MQYLKTYMKNCTDKSNRHQLTVKRLRELLTNAEISRGLADIDEKDELREESVVVDIVGPMMEQEDNETEEPMIVDENNHYRHDDKYDEPMVVVEDESDVSDKETELMSFHERDKIIRCWIEKTDDELFVLGQKEMPDFVMKSRRMKGRLKEYLDTFMLERAYSSSQEVLENFSQVPEVVQESKAFKDMIKHLSYEERARRLKDISYSDTLHHLLETPGKQARD